MKTQGLPDPYAGNILTEGLGALRSPEQVAKALLHRPELPPPMQGIPPYIAVHMLMSVVDLHLPRLVTTRLHQTIELMVRRSYSYRDPKLASTWASISGQAGVSRPPAMPIFAAAVEGYSGTGKSEAIKRCFATFPSQIVHHRSFPNIVGGFNQPVYLSVLAPENGGGAELARQLMRAYDAACGTKRFEHELSIERPNPMKMLETWQQVACASFLGILHIDEIQNLFKLPSLKERSAKNNSRRRAELKVAQDQTLRWLLNFMSTSQIPVLISGTPDGMRALKRRAATTQRIVTMGAHEFTPFESANDISYRDTFLKELGKYQFVHTKLAVDDDLAKLIIELTAGVPRIIIALWIAAHRIAYERKTNDLRLSDFKKASETYLKPVASAVAALKSGDPSRMAAFEDMMPTEVDFWDQFWTNGSST
jgi:AAA domain